MTMFHGMQLPSRLSASYIVAGMGVFWAAMGTALLLASEFLAHDISKCVSQRVDLLLVSSSKEDFVNHYYRGSSYPRWCACRHALTNRPCLPPCRLVYCGFSILCYTVGAFTTYGLAGYLRYSKQGPVLKPERSLAALQGGSKGYVLSRPSTLPQTASSSSSENSSDGSCSPGVSRSSSTSSGLSSMGASAVGAFDPGEARWRFWQPFVGGPVFVATQVCVSQPTAVPPRA